MLEKDALLWVYATGKESCSHVQDALAQVRWVLGDSDGVQVNDAVQHGAGLVLQAHPALNGSQVIAQVGGSCGLNAGEYSPHGIFLEQRKTDIFASGVESTNLMSRLP